VSATPLHEFPPPRPSPERRRQIAEAVHRAVCRATDTSGLGLCAVYAAVAVAVLGRLTGARYVLQAGMISIRLSAAHRAAHPFGCTHFTMDGRPRRPGGRSRALDLLPEFHAWAGRVHRAPGLATPEDFARHSELVDLSARHYRTNIQAIDRAWPGEGDFDGDFLWTTGDRLPDGLVLVPDMATTLAVASRLEDGPLRRIVSSAAREALAELSALGCADASKVGRNEACPCGSGRKFKKCCGGALLKAA
jgi:hypothetical protein